MLIHKLNPNAFNIWDDFSKQSKKYKSGECYEKWKSFSNSNDFDVKKQMAILHKWIAEDNQENIEEIQNRITTNKIIKHNKFDNVKNTLKIAHICECVDHNKIKLIDNYCDLNQLYHDNNDTYIKINPDNIFMLCSNALCRGMFNQKDLILTNKEKHNMFSLSQINNYNNITINNNNNNYLSGGGENETFTFQEDNVFDDKELNKLLFECVNVKSPSAYAKLFFKKKRDVLMFDKKEWYFCENGCWKKLKTLRNMIENELKEYYLDLENHYIGNEKQMLNVKKAYKHLTQTKIKTDIVYELEHNYDNEMFNFNENKNLISFNNGVYDLEKLIFRKKEPKDRLTYSTKYDYTETKTEKYEELLKFIDLIQPNKELQIYMLNYFAYCLNSNNDKFITALMGNTQIIELLEATFGDYYECISNSKNIDNTKKLIVFKKDITKLDKTLYENIEMGNTNILISCSKLPTLDNNIVMKEKFRVINVINNTTKPNFNEYKNDFMLLLIDNYKKYVNQKHIIPTINNMGWSARKNIDIYLYFVNECMETSTNHIDMDVLYEYFKQWYVKNISYLTAIPMKRKFVKEIKKHKSVVDVKFDGKSRIGIRFTQIKS